MTREPSPCHMDKESGNVYLRARYYDPSSGRFISEDSYEGEINQPLSLNLYTYCSNNSVNYKDPSGFDELGDALLLAQKNDKDKDSDTGMTDEEAMKVFCDFVSGQEVTELDFNAAVAYWSTHGQTSLRQYEHEDWNKRKYNRYDKYILAWTNFWNSYLKEKRPDSWKAIDANVIKAMMYCESKMGYHPYGHIPSVDLMQSCDPSNPCIQKLASVDPSKYNVGEGSNLLPKNGYGLAKNLFENGVFQESNVTVNTSICFGVRWYEYQLVRAGGNTEKAVKSYNVGNPRYYIEYKDLFDDGKRDLP